MQSPERLRLQDHAEAYGLSFCPTGCVKARIPTLEFSSGEFSIPLGMSLPLMENYSISPVCKNLSSNSFLSDILAVVLFVFFLLFLLFLFTVSILFNLQDEEINQQSQLAEKLKQQMLDQEEVRNLQKHEDLQSFESCLHVKLYCINLAVFFLPYFSDHKMLYSNLLDSFYSV